MNRCFQVAAAIVLALPAPAQLLVDSERAAPLRLLFDEASSAPSLRCEISPMRPSLNFAFQFQVVYKVTVPMPQFRGPGHTLSTHTRITPEGREPVYFTKTETLPEVPDGKIDGETLGAFVAGEGAYKAEVLVQDDANRMCRSTWQVQARRTGSERQLTASTPPLTVEELSLNGPATAAAKSGPRASRITILLHAAPLTPAQSELQPEDIQRSVDSIASLLREIPTRTVRLVAFNLDQRATIFREEDFQPDHSPALTEALERLQLGVVDYKAMRERPEPLELLLGLVQAELQAPQPPDALIVIGPRTLMQLDIPAGAFGKPAAIPVFHLQYQFNRPLRPSLMPSGRPMPRNGPINADGAPMGGVLPTLVDTTERLIARLKGQTIPIRTPHDLADAIQRMDARIPKTAPPAEPTRARPSLKRTVEPEASEPAGDEDPISLLVRLRERVSAHGDRIPNHTCVEAIQRDVFAPAAGSATKSCDTLIAAARQRDAGRRLSLQSTDRLRLDVAYATSGRELYSWVGANKFEEGEIDELVPEGAFGSGPFTAMLLSVFSNDGSKYTFEGESTLEGRRAFEYSFAVTADRSHYRVKAQKEWIITGYTGTLLVDPKTADLIRVTVRTEELPPETNTCETTTWLDYSMVELSGDAYLLPKASRQRFIGRNGFEAENTMGFSACRDFQAQSKVAFGENAPAPETQPAAPASNLPGGLTVTVDLAAAVHLNDAAAGDPVSGRLASAVRDAQGNLLLAEGALVQGRLMRVETRFTPRAERTVVLRWETVETAAGRVPIVLRPRREVPVPPRGGGLRTRNSSFELPRPSEIRYHAATLPASTSTLDAGFRTEWFTTRP